MKIQLPEYDLSDFQTKEGLFCGIPSILVYPQSIKVKFNQRNKIFRSSIWSVDGDLLSASFPKFVNFGENPDNFPVPTNINGWTFVEKVDGSCVIVDYVNDIFSARTRGTFTYTGMENAVDFEQAFQKYPNVAEFVKEYPHYSLLLEITTPNLKIILNYGEDVDFFLTGCVDKRTYTLLKQKELDLISQKIGVKRPMYYTFSSIQELLENVDAWKGKEGVVSYGPDGQELFKNKSDWYRNLHAAKENFRNIEAVIDVWYTFGEPNYTEFVQQLSEHYDYETMLICQGFISRICDAAKGVQDIIEGMQYYVDNTLLPLGDPFDKKVRGQQARNVISSYGVTNRANFVFKLLEGKSLNAEDKKKLMYQVLKK